MEILNEDEKKRRAITILNSYIAGRVPVLNRMDDRTMQEHFEWLESLRLKIDFEYQFCRNVLSKKGLIKYSDSIPKTKGLSIEPSERIKRGRPKGNGETKVKLSPQEKAIADLLKLGIGREDAVKMVAQLKGE